MRHDARYGTAIGLLDEILQGAPAEKVLTNWARSNRYAGSKDRAAVRDIVFDCLRCRSSYQALSGTMGGRGLVLGQVIATGQDLDIVFTGQLHAPEVLSPQERQRAADGSSKKVYDVPEWLLPLLLESLGDEFESVMSALRERAPVDLRVNLLKSNVAYAAMALAEDGVSTEPLSHLPSGLRVTAGERKVAQSSAYREGLIELQDAGSQAVVSSLHLDGVDTVLDYCAGGGGKSLAIVASTAGRLRMTAFDKSQSRLKNLSERAERAGAEVELAKSDPARGKDRYDLVLLDVPCSGSGAWRRSPDAKWRFSQEDLQALTATQDGILEATMGLVAKGGILAYITCSLLRAENETRINEFLARNEGWQKQAEQRFPLGRFGDGFYLCEMTRVD